MTIPFPPPPPQSRVIFLVQKGLDTQQHLGYASAILPFFFFDKHAPRNFIGLSHMQPNNTLLCNRLLQKTPSMYKSGDK